VDEGKRQVRISINPNIYTYVYVKHTTKMFEDLFITNIKKSKDEIQVLLKSKTRSIKNSELQDNAYEFLNCLLGTMKQIKTSQAREW